MAEICPTARLEKLLLSTDGSEFSEGAIREAINLAKRCSSKLFAVSVVEANPEFISLAPAVVEKFEEGTRRHLESVKERASKEGVDCEIIVHEGEEPYRYIVDEAEKREAEMIIMGRRGRTGLKRLMMGSVTARVIGHATRNILVVPRAAYIKWKNIVIATDGSKYSEAAAKKAIEITEMTGANLFAVAVTRPDASESRIKESEDALIRIRMNGEKSVLKVKTEHIREKPHEKIYEAIIEFAKKNNADLIVIGSHGRTGLTKLLMGSVAERVIGYSDCAVLVVKSQ